MFSSSLELVNDSFTLVTLPNSTGIVLKINQSFLDKDPNQIESLLYSHQVIPVGMIVDDCSKINITTSGKPLGQCININNKQFEMIFYRWKNYFKIQKSTDGDLARYEILELTSELNYSP